MTALSKALMAVKNLETLNLGYNNITNEGVHRLKDGLLKNRSILRLGMQCTKVNIVLYLHYDVAVSSIVTIYAVYARNKTTTSFSI